MRSAGFHLKTYRSDCFLELFEVKCADCKVSTWYRFSKMMKGDKSVKKNIKTQLPGEQGFPTGHFRQLVGSWKRPVGTESTVSTLNHDQDSYLL